MLTRDRPPIYLPLLTFVDIWTTTYLPRLVNVVCERPLMLPMLSIKREIRPDISLSTYLKSAKACYLSMTFSKKKETI